MTRRRVLVTGLGMELPGIADPEDLLRVRKLAIDREAFYPERMLGKKGLYGKDRATRLALCATQRALLDTGDLNATLRASFGVVVGCSLGNLESVCHAVQTIEAGRLNDLSAMDLPNASSNIVASTIAIRFGCRGLNLTVCGGSDSGTQAIALASNAILAGRLQRTIVVGAESQTAASEALLAQSFERWLGRPAPLRMMEGAAALVLEAEDQATAHGARRLRMRGSPDGACHVRSGGVLSQHPESAGFSPGNVVDARSGVPRRRACNPRDLCELADEHAAPRRSRLDAWRRVCTGRGIAGTRRVPVARSSRRRICIDD